MTSLEIEPQIQDIVQKITFRHVDRAQALLSTQLLDSIGVVDLIVQLEEKFGVGFDLQQVNEERFNTVEQIAREVAERLK
ncbi:MAG TPA: acyl carrier protein [Bdellovibrionales bacterium]|nr:acyl carrier protein [Bdellovibrionales bacterium]